MRMPQIFVIRLIGSLVLCLLFSSCVKDVDFNQAGDITLSPEVQTDLLYYTLNENNFINPETKELKKVLSDTVRLEFLDDDYIQEDLNWVEFDFRNENTFPQEFVTTIYFIDENNREQFHVQYGIPAGNKTSAENIQKKRMMKGNEVNAVKKSIKMVVEIERLPSKAEFIGELSFSSKGLFKFDF